MGLHAELLESEGTVCLLKITDCLERYLETARERRNISGWGLGLGFFLLFPTENERSKVELGHVFVEVFINSVHTITEIKNSTLVSSFLCHLAVLVKLILVSASVFAEKLQAFLLVTFLLEPRGSKFFCFFTSLSFKGTWK